MKECLKALSAEDIINAGYGYTSFNLSVIDGKLLSGRYH